MIKAVFKEKEVLIKGHSMYANAGQDIVCSAVSSITQFVAQILLEEKTANCEIKEGYLKIKIISNDEMTIKLVRYMKEALMGIEEDYPKHLKVEVK